MKIRILQRLFFACSVVFVLTGCATSEPHYLDLTYAFDEHTIYWPKNKHFHREETAKGMSPNGYWYASGTFSASEHGGTHLDAPIHFAETGMSSDQIPVDTLIGPAVVLDIQAACQRNPDYELTVQDILDWETQHGRITPHDLVLLRTGWGAFYHTKERYLGSSTPHDPHTLHFPGFSPEAMRFLVHDRHIRGVGIDTASIDPGQSQYFEAHQILSAANRYALENVAHLDKLPPRGVTIFALPMKIKNGTGGPTRIIARIPNRPEK